MVREARALAAAGTKEISLVAQDLTTYGTDLDPAALGRAPCRRWRRCCDGLAGVDGIRWLRLHYAYPTACTTSCST